MYMVNEQIFVKASKRVSVLGRISESGKQKKKKKKRNDKSYVQIN